MSFDIKLKWVAENVIDAFIKREEASSGEN